MQLSKVLLLGLSHFSIDVKQTESKVTVVFSPKTTVTDPAVKDLKPLIINFDSPEEMDTKFVEMITGPVEKTVKLFNGITDYEKQLAEAAKKTKAAAEEKKTATATAVKKKEEIKKTNPTLEFSEPAPEPKEKEVVVEPKEEVPVEEPAVVEAEVVEETITEKQEAEVFEAVQEEDEEVESEDDLFAGMPDLFS